MSHRLNEFGQPIGWTVADWSARPRPGREPMAGRHCQVLALDHTRHADDLWAALCPQGNQASWTYLPYGPFPDQDAFDQWLSSAALKDDPLFHAIVDQRTGKAVGIASFLRIDPANGVIEVGHIHFSQSLRRSAAATEAMALMMARVFDELGYRRYEWKCDALNQPSRAAAERLGFRFEGIFRQAIVTKGRNRDTAWYSVIDSDWPALKQRFARWIGPANFDEAGRQRQSLSAL
ncbi:MAG: GNAT family N-acetyltransferase [Alphaproteobacteria bacterium]|nr:GNAT family N-acetyltransferase [Alphaproteobacteria bacterium]